MAYGKDCIDDKLWNELAKSFAAIRAAQQEDNSNYEDSALLYNVAGMREKAKEMESKIEGSVIKLIDPEAAERYKKAVEETKNKFKDFPLLSETDRLSIMEEIERDIKTELGEK